MSGKYETCVNLTGIFCFMCCLNKLNTNNRNKFVFNLVIYFKPFILRLYFFVIVYLEIFRASYIENISQA